MRPILIAWSRSWPLAHVSLWQVVDEGRDGNRSSRHWTPLCIAWSLDRADRRHICVMSPASKAQSMPAAKPEPAPPSAGLWITSNTGRYPPIKPGQSTVGLKNKAQATAAVIPSSCGGRECRARLPDPKSGSGQCPWAWSLKHYSRSGLPTHSDCAGRYC